MQENVRTIAELEAMQNSEVRKIDHVAHRIAKFSGSVTFVIAHVLLFTAWIAWNTLTKSFDPYPFTFLTMTVSLESIFLSTFVMISQNALSEQSERRHKLDLQINLLAEQENTAQLRVLFKLGQKLGLTEADLEELQTYLDDADPRALMDEITEAERTLIAT